MRGASNWYENVWPGSRMSLSNEPSFALTVCGTESVFVQVTTPPVPTVTLAGENWLFAIVTSAEPTPTGPPVAALAAAPLPVVDALCPACDDPPVTTAGFGSSGVATTTVAVISGWNEQKYVYVPGAVKVREYVPPLRSIPESNDESSAVTVCGTESRFVQVTVPPTAIVIVAGLNALPEIDTEPVVGSAAPDPPDPPPPVVPPPDSHRDAL